MQFYRVKKFTLVSLLFVTKKPVVQHQMTTELATVCLLLEKGNLRTGLTFYVSVYSLYRPQVAKKSTHSAICLSK